MRRPASFTRRALLQSGGALLIVGCELEKIPGDTPDPADTGLDTGALDTGALDTGALDTGGLPTYTPYEELGADCSTLTEVRGLGPFYIEGAPPRSQMNIYGRDGLPIRVYVEVVDQDCAPVPGAFVEVWHCGPDEIYEMDDPEMPYRTALFADADGRLAFETIQPPPYEDEAGLMRPHIHYQTSAEGFLTLSSQTKFAHDAELDEPLTSAVVLTFTEVGGVLCASYRIVLERAPAPA